MTDPTSKEQTYCRCGVLESVDHGCPVTYARAKSEIEQLRAELQGVRLGAEGMGWAPRSPVETKSYSCEIDGPHHYECKHCHIPLPGLSQETTKHYCASCGAEGEPGSPKYCSADCAEKASTKP